MLDSEVILQRNSVEELLGLLLHTSGHTSCFSHPNKSWHPEIVPSDGSTLLYDHQLSKHIGEKVSHAVELDTLDCQTISH